MADETAEDLRVEHKGAVVLATLNRPKALNALTGAMRTRFSEALWSAARNPDTYAVILQSASERAFSTGSDVREVIAWGRTDPAKAKAAFAEEYTLNWQCECFSKPTIPLINGVVMGGGVGISQYGTHRVAGENYAFAMPETMIGLFPDVGTCYVLGRLPGEAGTYLGLTGHTIKRTDAYALGLVTHCIDSGEFEAITSEICDAWPVDPALDNRHRDPGPGDLTPYAETIERCFSAPTVEEIIARLDGVTGSAADWAKKVAADLRLRSPISLKITLRHLREAPKRDLRETLRVDYRLALRCLEDNDFYEGVRAALIDKDGAPRWRPSKLEAVTHGMVKLYFSPLGSADLTLPSREDMQALRA
jgi:enoyl-CoA hydratase